MRFRRKDLPGLWWLPFAGMGVLVLCGAIAIATYFGGLLLSPAQKSRINVERGDVTLAQLDEAIRLNPTYADAFVRRAKLRLAANDPAGADSDLATAMTYRTNDVSLLQLRAEIHKAIAATQP